LNPRFNLPFLAYHVLPDTGGAYHDQTMSSCDINPRFNLPFLA